MKLIKFDNTSQHISLMMMLLEMCMHVNLFILHTYVHMYIFNIRCSAWDVKVLFGFRRYSCSYVLFFFCQSLNLNTLCACVYLHIYHIFVLQTNTPYNCYHFTQLFCSCVLTMHTFVTLLTLNKSLCGVMGVERMSLV